MTELSAIRQLQPLPTFAPPREAKERAAPSWLASAIRQRDLIVVIGFCAVGLIVTLAALTQLSAFSEAIGAISLVP